MSMLLEVKELSASYGASRVLQGISFGVEEGSITVLLGANGAGKTTTLRALTGMVRTAGSIRLRGKELCGLNTESIAQLGVAHVPDGRGTFLGLTVEENLQLGAYSRKDKPGVTKDIAQVYELFPRLGERRGQQAGTLSGGEQQMLAISRALMMKPTLLLLDEPSFGIAPLIVKEIFELLKQINREQKVSILLVEQNAAMTLAMSNYAYLLEIGRIVISGPSREIRENEAIRKSYLGS
ncbi:ABC transporter ATP-binding protein [Undibacterium sp. TJN25]|uniref:ABC transporter ATP-binding protein n=1 Tax=Undibacterium sp. TJN25 TaxID=3413056 RepID=UPI003BF20C96